MKKWVSLLLFCSTFLFAELHFMTDYDAALKLAKSEDKQILLMLSKEDCPSCWWMKTVAFKDEKLVKRIKQSFIPVMVDVIKEEVPMNLEYIGTPTFYFLTKNQDQRSRIDGARSVEKFHQLLDILE